MRCTARLLSYLLLCLVLQAEDGGEGACRRLSLESNSSTLDGGSKANTRTLSDADSTLQPASSTKQPEQQQAQDGGDGDDQQMSGWPQDDDMVVIQDWDDSSLAQYDALDVAAAAASDEQAAGALDTTPAEEQDGSLQQDMPAAATNHGEWLCHCSQIITGSKLVCARQLCKVQGMLLVNVDAITIPAQPAMCVLELVSAYCLQVTSALRVTCSRSTSVTYLAQALTQGRSTQTCARTSSGKAYQQCESLLRLFCRCLQPSYVCKAQTRNQCAWYL
jgi:hypothetical protein